MDIYSYPQSDIYRLLLVGFPLLMLTGPAVILAGSRLVSAIRSKPDQDLLSGSILTVTAVAAAIMTLLPAVVSHGIGDVSDFLADFRTDHGLPGWTLTIAVAFNLLSPIATGLCLLVSHRRLRRQDSYRFA